MHDSMDTMEKCGSTSSVATIFSMNGATFGNIFFGKGELKIQSIIRAVKKRYITISSRSLWLLWSHICRNLPLYSVMLTKGTLTCNLNAK